MLSGEPGTAEATRAPTPCGARAGEASPRFLRSWRSRRSRLRAPRTGTAPTGATYVDPYLLAKAQTRPELTGQRDHREQRRPLERAERVRVRRGQPSARQDRSPRVQVRRARSRSRLKAKQGAARWPDIPGLTITSDSRVKLDRQSDLEPGLADREALRPFYKDTDRYRGADADDRDRRLGNRAEPRRLRRRRPRRRRQVDHDAPAELARRRPRPRHVRRRHRRGHGAPAMRARLRRPRSSRSTSWTTTGMARTSDVIAAADWIYAEQGRVQHPRRELLAPLDGRRATSRTTRSTRRSRSSGSAASPSSPPPATTATARRPERRAVRARQRPVRDHGRRGRPRRHVRSPNDDVAAPWSAYGYTLRRLPRSPSSRRPAATWSARCPTARRSSASAPTTSSRPATCELSGHVVRGAGRRRRRRPDPRPAPGLDARPGQGRADADGALRPRRTSRLAPGSARSTPSASADMLNRPRTRTWRWTGSSSTDPAGGATPVFDAASWSDAGHRTSPGTRLLVDASWSDASWTDVTGPTCPGATSPGRTSPGATCSQRPTSPGRTRPGRRRSTHRPDADYADSRGRAAAAGRPRLGSPGRRRLHAIALTRLPNAATGRSARPRSLGRGMPASRGPYVETRSLPLRLLAPD